MLSVVIIAGCNAQGKQKKSPVVTFSKQVLTKDFVSEGVAVGDVNRDGKTDVIAGAFWFEAPDWKKHEIANPVKYVVGEGYSNSFLNFSMDVNQDGWIDQVRIDWPGKAAVWHENPKNKPGHWPMYVIHASVGNESPLFVDIDGDGRMDILCNDSEKKQIIWLKSPSQKGDNAWTLTVIDGSEGIPGTHQYTHGLGYADINADGRKDVLINKGWWEGPADPKQPGWKFHPADLGKDCAQMYVMDLNADGLADFISSAAHQYGIWWHEQKRNERGEITFIHHLIDSSFSQSHSLALADVNGDGAPDLITGKRYFAHNGGDPGAHDPAVLNWYEYKPGKMPSWKKHEVDNDSGSGLNLVVEDINGDRLPDIVLSNKKGVHVFLQKK
ncbi:MAG: VCBS repeat-containing protein [Chitinophagaceae bacterium]|nr:VCBS repeat-containing protein [Chitinophagaceae bacterium]